MSLERIESNLKATALGKIEAYFERGEIKVETYERLFFLVENIFTSDLNKIINGNLKDFNKYSPSTKNLISIGILEEKFKITANDYLKRNFSSNDLTYKFENKGFRITNFGELFEGIMMNKKIDVNFSETYSIPRF